MRTITKEVEHEIDGTTYKFQIKKMDALRGSYLLKFCTEKLLPLFDGLKGAFSAIPEGTKEEDVQKIAQERTDMLLEVIPKALSSISEEELISFEMRCLETVSMLKPAGWQPVIIGKSFGVEEVESDVGTVLMLCYEVVEFNMGSFFGGKSLGSLLSLKNSSRHGA